MGMFEYGQRPEDVVVNARTGRPYSTTLGVYATEADARAATNVLAVVTVTDGRWSFTSTLTSVWVRMTDGSVWLCESPGALTLDNVPAGLVIGTDGTTRPSTRADLKCIFTGDDPGAEALDGDLWERP